MNWLHELKPNLRSFLKLMQENDYAYFKYSFSGDLYTLHDRWGLANTVFAVRILYITGLLDELSSLQKHNLYKSIINFSDSNGTFSDPLLHYYSFKEKILRTKAIIRSKGLKTLFFETDNQIKRAETRQTFAALYLLGHTPPKPFPVAKDKQDIYKYLNSYNWKQPYSAGGNLNHLLFFLRINEELFPQNKNNSEDLINYIIDWVNKIQSPIDGCWYSGKTSLFQKINGAMKILNGFHSACRYKVNYAKQLIDTVLSAINDIQACDNFNIVYVLYGASRVEPDYRKDEIRNFLLNRLRIYEEFYFRSPGGFSFNKRYAQPNIYGKTINKGLPEPDIHGTAMFVWGIAIIDNMINLGLDWKIPLN